MRNIIHQRIPIDENGTNLIAWDEVAKIHNYMLNAIPKDYILITSPMELNKVDGDMKIIKIDCKEYSANELLGIIEKANMYDNLNK